MIEYIFGDDTLTGRGVIKEKARALRANIRWVEKEDIERGSVESILDSAQGSLLGAIIVVFRDPSTYSEDVQEIILKKIEQSAPGNVVLWDPLVDRRLGFYKKIKKLTSISEYNQPKKDDDMVRWTSLYIKEYRKDLRMDIQAIRELVRRVGCDVWGVASELDKLSAISQSIEIADVVRIVPQREHAYESAFPLLEAIAQKRSQRAIAILADMQKEGATERFILAMLTYQFRLFLAVRMGKDSRFSVDDIHKKTGLHPVAIQKAMAIASTLSTAVILDILARVAAAEKSLITTTMDGRSIVTMLILGLCR